MKESTYRRIYSWAAPHAGTLSALNRLITWGVYGWFGIFLALLLWKQPLMLVPVLLVTGLSFVLVTVVRSRIGAPRPYEVFGTVPLVRKETKGKSFPSRHAFSIFIIASVTAVLYPLPGAILLAAGCLLAALRVLVGVHFVKDVTAGAVAGMLMGFGGMALAGLFVV